MVDSPETRTLQALVAERCLAPTRPAVGNFAAALMDRHAPAAVAVLAYGSCLRDVSLSEGLIDLYVIVNDYASAHASAVERWGNAVLPPNVYYGEHIFDDMTLRAKYAIVSLDQFEDRVSRTCSNPYFWARFAQPCALVTAVDAAHRERMIGALTTAVVTFLDETADLSPGDTPARERWIAGLEATYATELRSEGPARARAIVDMNAAYFEALAAAHGQAGRSTPTPRHSWVRRRIAGKMLSVARLVKAGFTFQGGADYIAWKIARHSGVEIAVKPWHRRHPIIAAAVMAPRLWLRGGFR